MRDGPPCWPLLQDPFRVLTDRSRWPRHLCDDLMSESTSEWVRRRFFLPGVASFLSTAWPLPVGRISLRRELKTWRESHLLTADAMSLMPFDGDEYAALVLYTQIGSSRIAVFGLFTREEFADPADFVFHPTGLSFQVQGDPSDPAVLRFVRHARVWWKQFGQSAVRRGRPPGTVDRNLGVYLKAYRAFVDERGHRPSMDQFVERSGIPLSTVKRQLRSWGIRWSSFRSWDLHSPFPR